MKLSRSCMTEIFSNSHLKIIQNIKSPHVYSIYFETSNPILIHSLVKTHILRGATYSDDYTSIRFAAYSVQKLNDIFATMTAQKVATMVATLGAQLKYMMDEYFHTFLGFNAENIIVIDDKYVFLDGEMIVEIDNKTNTGMIYSLDGLGDTFLSPELKNISSFPVKVHYKVSYFSLGCLLCYALLGDHTFYKEYLSSESNSIIHFLDVHPIKDTKLYWLLERCLIEEPEKRSIIFI